MWLLLASSPGPLPPVHLPASVCALRLPNRCPHPEGPSATHILSIDGMKWRSPPGPASSGGLEGILSHLSWPLVAAAVLWFLGLWPHRPHLGLHGHLASPPVCLSLRLLPTWRHKTTLRVHLHDPGSSPHLKTLDTTEGNVCRFQGPEPASPRGRSSACCTVPPRAGAAPPPCPQDSPARSRPHRLFLISS